MLHYYTFNDTEAHYGAVENCLSDTVLVQLGDSEGTQVRLKLTLGETRHLIDLLQGSINAITKVQEES